MKFKKKGYIRASNEIVMDEGETVNDVLQNIRGQRVPGELIVSLPGNGGVSAIVFKEKERPVDIV